MNFPWSDALAKAAGAIGIAVTIAGGGMVIDAQRDNAVQDEQISDLRDDMKQIGELSDKLDTTNQKLDELNGYIRGLQR